jgi:hypothetical protein
VFEIFFFVEIGCDVVCLAFAERIEFSTRLFAGGGVARGNVDVCAVLDEPFADHAANAFGAAGYEDDFVLGDWLDIEYNAWYQRKTAMEGMARRGLTLTSNRVALSILYSL